MPSYRPYQAVAAAGRAAVPGIEPTPPGVPARISLRSAATGLQRIVVTSARGERFLESSCGAADAFLSEKVLSAELRLSAFVFTIFLAKKSKRF